MNDEIIKFFKLQNYNIVKLTIFSIHLINFMCSYCTISERCGLFFAIYAVLFSVSIFYSVSGDPKSLLVANLIFAQNFKR